jgi:hypothetical protein
MKQSFLSNFINCAFLAVSLMLVSVWQVSFVPVTGISLSSFVKYPLQSSSLPSLESFISQVKYGDKEQVAGIYIPGRLALPVVQQPKDKPGYVSPTVDVVTQFDMASKFGSLGFLAHNYLAGSKFFEIAQDDIIHVIFGDGHYERYRVIQIRRLQALQPTSALSDFVDLGTGQKLTASDLFYETYGIKSQLVLQTCIAVGKQDSWGRLFVIATPYIPPGINHNQPIELQHQ